jgi:4-amino-4-deoxy-L-arabinose transferase-like glycosyltransferase
MGYFSKIKNWVKENRQEAIVLGLILITGAFLRLGKIDQYMTFLGDEGRDAIIVRRIFTELHPPLIGPGTSIGNMYLGPLYYYLIAPFLLLFNFSPVGPSVEVALFGITTIYLVWYIGRTWFGKIGGAVASALYAVSPTVIIYSRSSWNPNVMPFFALLCIYSVWKIWSSVKTSRDKEKDYKNFRWLIVLGISFAFALQSHYLGLLLLPTLVIFWLLILIKVRQQFNNVTMKQYRQFIKYSLLSVLIFLILMSPLVIFDMRHGWNNFRAIATFFTVRQETVSIKPWNAIPKIYGLFGSVNYRLITSGNIILGKAAAILVIAYLAWFLCLKIKNRVSFSSAIYSPLLLVLTWLGFGLLGMGLYKQGIYDHYFGFVFAAPFLLLGWVSQGLFDKLSNFHTKTKIIEASVRLSFVAAIFFLIGFNLYNNPFRYPPNRQLARAEDVAKKIIEEAGGNKFNLAVIAERNYEDGYKYFLLRFGAKVIDIDAQKYQETVADQLYAVCEMEKSKCDPVHSPKAQISGFGWSKVEESWEIDGVILYKLVHTK